METIQDNDTTIMMESVPYVEILMDEDEIIIVDEQEELNITLDTPEANVIELCDDIAVDIFKALQNNAKESTLLQESKDIKNKIANIDLSSVESKVEEESQAIQRKIDNIDVSTVENKVQLESAAIQNKIDNIQLPEINTDTLAKQGSDPEATNTAIFNAVNTFLSRSVKYDKTTGNLTIENVELTINE